MSTAFPRSASTAACLLLLVVTPGTVLGQASDSLMYFTEQPPNPAMVRPSREALVGAVVASSQAATAARVQAVSGGARATGGEEVEGPVALARRLLADEYPLAWVVEEVVFRFGNEQLPELVSMAHLMFGQASRDVVRDAVRRGAARRSAARAAAQRALRAGDGMVSVAGEGQVDAQIVAGWERVNWGLVELGERPTGVHYLYYNDDPGGYVSLQ